MSAIHNRDISPLSEVNEDSKGSAARSRHNMLKTTSSNASTKKQTIYGNKSSMLERPETVMESILESELS